MIWQERGASEALRSDASLLLEFRAKDPFGQGWGRRGSGGKWKWTKAQRGQIARQSFDLLGLPALDDFLALSNDAHRRGAGAAADQVVQGVASDRMLLRHRTGRKRIGLPVEGADQETTVRRSGVRCVSIPEPSGFCLLCFLSISFDFSVS